MRRAAKIDTNQPAIVRALKACGCTVTSLASVGKGVPDLLVGYHGENHLLEVKDGERVPSAKRLTEDELEWHTTWRGKVRVVESVDEALRAVGVTR
jgi:hypothetical protein